MAYQPIPTDVNRGETRIVSSDSTAEELLLAIVVRLDILLAHLALITETEIGPSDIGE